MAYGSDPKLGNVCDCSHQTYAIIGAREALDLEVYGGAIFGLLVPNSVGRETSIRALDAA